MKKPQLLRFFQGFVTKKEDETITLLISKWHMLLDEDAVIARTVPSSLLLHPTLTPKSSD